MRDLDRGKSLDHHLRMPLLQAAEHVHVILQPQLGMQSTHDMELTRWIVPRRVRFGEDLVQAAGVGAVFFRHAREGAEDAGVPQNADVGRIDVLVCGEVHSVAIASSVGEVREVAEGEQVVRCKKREAILARQSLAAFDLFGDRSEVHDTLRTASVTLCPPNPNELDSATSICRLTAWFGAESRSHAGSGLN